MCFGPVLLLGLTMMCILLSAFATASAPHPRSRVKNNHGWEFRLKPGDDLGVNQARWEWAIAEGVSMSLQELPATLNDLAWTSTTGAEDVFQGRAGMAWFRCELPPYEAFEDLHLRFGGVDDNVVVFVNGQRMVYHLGWSLAFSIPVAGAWSSDKPNQVVLLVQNTGGAGGVHGATWLERLGQVETPDFANPSAKTDGWRPVRIPHDYVVEGAFDPRASASHGFLPNPPAQYRQRFRLDSTFEGKRVRMVFDGVFRDAKVWLNGKKVAHHPSGYIGFSIDLTGLPTGVEHLIALEVDPRQHTGWWYEGGGIYRNVWIKAKQPISLAPDGVFVRTELEQPDRALVRVQADLQNQTPSTVRAQIVHQVLTHLGDVVASHESILEVGPSSVARLDTTVAVDAPALWSLEHPNLYTLVTQVSVQGELVDEVQTKFGIRTIRWCPEEGFFLNGHPVKLKGTNNHQDHAGVGVALPVSLMEWRIRQLKALGSNAYRSAHHPPAPELLEICDRLGMLVINENRHLGDATTAKTPLDATADDLGELRAMILRDRNHPCIIAWSMCNEENIQNTPQGAALFAKMKSVTQELDPTRPVMAAMNFGWFEGLGPLVEVMGINYNTTVYEEFRGRMPHIPLVVSESASAVSTRSVYANDTERGYVSAYDVNHPQWGNTAQEAWQSVADRPWIAGAFVWTGFDYKSEPTPYSWPCINSHFGILDICGIPKDTAWYYKAWWKGDPLVHILPHWNWQGREGEPIEVWVHGNTDEVELFLSGRSLGKQAMPRLGHLRWTVPYEPGRLEAVGTTGGQPVSQDLVETSGPAVRLALRTERNSLKADDDDCAVVFVWAEDAHGRPVPTASHMVEFELEGPGEIIGVGNGDPSSHEPDKSNRRSLFQGKAMVIVQARTKAGSLKLTARCRGLSSASLTLPVSMPRR